VRFASDRVAPSQAVETTIRVNSGNRKGAQSQHFVLRASDGRTTSSLELSVAWTVRAFLECIPETIDLGTKFYSTTQDCQVTLDAEGLTTPVRIVAVRCPSPHVAINPENAGVPAGLIIRLSVLPTIPVGDFETSITIATDSAKEPLLYVPIKGKIAGPFIVERPYVNFGVVPLGKISEQKVAIQRRIPSERIVGMEYDHAALDCELSGDFCTPSA
jgi:hypothetical protein